MTIYVMYTLDMLLDIIFSEVEPNIMTYVYIEIELSYIQELLFT